MFGGDGSPLLRSHLRRAVVRVSGPAWGFGVSDLFTSHSWSLDSEYCTECAAWRWGVEAGWSCEPSTDDSAFGPVVADYSDEMVEF